MDIIAAIISMVGLIAFLRVWQPKRIWTSPSLKGHEADGGQAKPTTAVVRHSRAELLRASTPWALLTIFVFIWGLPADLKSRRRRPLHDRRGDGVGAGGATGSWRGGTRAHAGTGAGTPRPCRVPGPLVGVPACDGSQSLRTWQGPFPGIWPSDGAWHGPTLAFRDRVGRGSCRIDTHGRGRLPGTPPGSPTARCGRATQVGHTGADTDDVMSCLAVPFESLRRRLRAGLVVAVLAWMAGLAQAQEVPALRVDDRPEIQAWPAVGVLTDADDRFSAQALADRPDLFERPTGTPSNLGRRDATVWLRIPVQVPGSIQVRRIVEIDYPPLNRIDVWLVRDGQLTHHVTMGNELPLAKRPLPTRTHAAPVDLSPGDSVLLLRVRTSSSMVLPVMLLTDTSLTAQESRMYLVQGVFLGTVLCMLLYSMTHFAHLRDTMFLLYALELIGITAFTLSYFGIGSVYLWPNTPAIATHIAPMGIMLSIAAGASFARTTLGVYEISPGTAMMLRVFGALAILSLVLTGLGWLHYRHAQSLATVLGLATMLSVQPVAFMRARRREPVAALLLLGWLLYAVGAATAAGILRGLIEPTFASQQIFPFSMLFEMTAWLTVLGLRVKDVHRRANRAAVEAETQRTLSETDPLTGLLNRRGLQARLAVELASCARAQKPTRHQSRGGLALYLLDLDGFKPINDRHGHDVGDALLVAVGQRLRGELRNSDVVARLGGDEFVVLAPDLPSEATAHLLGQSLLAAFEQPFAVLGRVCEVGITVGYALAPQDGLTASDLLKRADEAMYAGKAAGRRSVRRADGTHPPRPKLEAAA